MHETYFSVDVETDGSIPGHHSLLSVGVVVAGVSTDRGYEAYPLDHTTFYAELQPQFNNFEPAALEVNGLGRERLQTTGAHPMVVVYKLYEWVKVAAGSTAPVMVAYPLVFDWMWLHWHFMRYLGKSPFGHSAGLCLKHLLATTLAKRITEVSYKQLPPELTSDLPHTHHALEDATRQADVFNRCHKLMKGM